MRDVSFDVTPLFTNVPLNKTVNIVLTRIYDQKLIETTLKRRTLKKFLLDVCKKTAFSFNIVFMRRSTVSLWDLLLTLP